MDIAKSMEKDDLCIYSFTRSYGEMIPVDEFIRHLKKSLQMIETQIGKDLSNLEDREIIKQDRNLSSILMTLNF
jgi:hypothetical protein